MTLIKAVARTVGWRGASCAGHASSLTDRPVSANHSSIRAVLVPLYPSCSCRGHVTPEFDILSARGAPSPRHRDIDRPNWCPHGRRVRRLAFTSAANALTPQRHSLGAPHATTTDALRDETARGCDNLYVSARPTPTEAKLGA